MTSDDHGTLRHGVASPWRSRPLPPGDNMLAKLLASTDWPYCYTTRLACEDWMGRIPLKVTEYHTKNALCRAACHNTVHLLEAKKLQHCIQQVNM